MIRYLSLVLVILSIIQLSACAYTLTAKNHSDANISLENIQSLFYERRFNEIISTLNTMPEHLDSERRLLLAESYYRVADYTKASKHFEFLLTDADLMWTAQHRIWASRIMIHNNDNSIKKEIRKEIQSLQNTEHNLELWWALYHGYRYLNDLKGREFAIQRLAQQATTTEEKADVATTLLEESLEGNEKRRQRLAERYLDQFADQPGLHDISRLWLRFSTSPMTQADVTSLSAVMNRFPENRFIALEMAVLSSESHTLLPTATQALKRYQNLRKTLPDNDIPLSENNRHLLANGKILFRQGDLDKARKILASIPEQDKSFPLSRMYLAEIALQQKNENQAKMLLKEAINTGLKPSHLTPEIKRWIENIDNSGGLISSSIQFDDVTQAIGLANIHSESIAWGDFDADGREDLLLDGPRLYKNNTNVFVDQSTRIQQSLPNPSTGGLWLDVNNDGNLDILVWGRFGARLYVQNQGQFERDTTHFSDTLVTGNVSAAAAADMDQDGDLDIYVARYEQAAVERGICLPDQLLENRGKDGFTDVTLKSHIYKDEPYCGRGVIWTDFNQDRRPDILVSNYRLDPNTAWIREPDGTYVDKAKELGLRGNNNQGYYGHSIGADLSDINGDGAEEIYLTNLAHPRQLSISDTSMLLINNNDRYTDHREQSGIRFEETNADPAFGDINNDGYPDLYVSSIYPGRFGHLWLNNSHGQFTDITWPSGTLMENGWATTFNDYDNDGRLDLLVASRDGIRLFKNRSRTKHWLSVLIKTKECNRFGIGSQIQLITGGRKLLRSIYASKGTGTQQGHRIHFGLDDHIGPVKLVVDDVCNRRVKFDIKQVDRIVKIQY